MAIDREDTLKKAEKLLRQGKLDAAIAEYLKVVEENPGDWATANTLGDLYARAGQRDLERLLATRSVSPLAADQTQIPFRFSIMVTSLRRSAWRRDWTTLKTTELRSGVSDTSSLRAMSTRHASGALVASTPIALWPRP